jgi:guanine nucleotide-binding protein subunit alpha
VRSQVALERYFPEYTGGADINKAAKYILWKFMQANRARLSVYPQYVYSFRLCIETGLINVHVFSLTQATDTTNIRLVFAAVKETILQNALKDSGIL